MTSKPKKQALGAFRDAYADAYAARDEPPPPTLRAAELESLFIASRSAPAPAPASAPGDAPEDGAEKRLGCRALRYRSTANVFVCISRVSIVINPDGLRSALRAGVGAAWRSEAPEDGRQGGPSADARAGGGAAGRV